MCYILNMKRQGYSLLEIILSLTIFSLIIVSMLPGMVSLRNHSAVGTALIEQTLRKWSDPISPMINTYWSDGVNQLLTYSTENWGYLEFVSP